MPRLIASLLALAALLAVAPAASAQGRAVAIGATARTEVMPPPRPGVQRLHYEFGPVHIAPGQNTIEFEGNALKPDVPGHIVRFKPDLEYADGTIPRVDVIHLHHGVWISNFAPLFAAGEEKTIVTAPDGYGWNYEPQDKWLMNHMIHNLTPTATDVYITYDLDFIPAGTEADRASRTSRTVWLDVVGGIYPVFDVHKGAGGRDRRYTYPDEAPAAERGRGRWTVQQDGVLVATAGHLHPGGLWTDLKVTRGGRTVRVFRSVAKYYEPAGAVSWDVSMTATPENWRVGVRKGDVVSTSATYDTRRSSWYESMGIMPVAFNAGGTGPRPVRHERRRARPGHARAPGGEPQPRRRLRRPARRAAAALRPAAALADGADQRLPLRPGRPRHDAAARGARRRSAPASRCASSTATRSGTSSTRSRAARRPATAPRASPTRSRTARCGSTRATSASGPRAARRPPSGSRGGRRRRSAPAPTRTSAACTRSCAGRSGSSVGLPAGGGAPAYVNGSG